MRTSGWRNPTRFHLIFQPSQMKLELSLNQFTFWFPMMALFVSEQVVSTMALVGVLGYTWYTGFNERKYGESTKRQTEIPEAIPETNQVKGNSILYFMMSTSLFTISSISGIMLSRTKGKRLYERQYKKRGIHWRNKFLQSSVHCLSGA